MDLLPNDPRTRKFVTNVGLITSSGPFGDNIMACEWAHHISYAPSLIAVCIRPFKATFINIKKTKEFGVSIASVEQNVISSIAGNTSGKETDKIKALKELGFEFYPAKKIKTLMVKDAVVNAECKLRKLVNIGDHPILIGEVIEISAADREPLAYYQGKYWHLGEQIQKPDEEVLAKIAKTLEKFKKTFL